MFIVMIRYEMNKIRVGLFCRVLPKYRLGIYEQLSKRSEIDLMVLYSNEPPWYSLKTVDPNGMFPSEVIEMKAWHFGKQEFLYHTDAARIIASGRFDVVILPANPRLLSNFPALRACKKHRVGIVWWGMAKMYKQKWVTYTLRRYLMKIPEAVLLYTKREAQELTDSGRSEEKIFVAQNTIDTTEMILEFQKWDNNRLLAFKEHYGLEGRKLLLYCARLTEVKRLDILLRSLAALVREDPSYLLAVIGDGGEKGRYVMEAEKLGIREHVRWLGSVYEQAKLAPWFLSAKAFIVPEGIGLAAFQSFAYSLPCITSDSRHHQSPEMEAIIHEENGLLYAHRDIKSLADNIKKICNDEKFRNILQKNAFITITEKYSCEKMVDGFHEAIRYAKKCVSL